MGNVLIDTNVLVYAYDWADPVKQRRAIDLLDYIRTTRIGAVSAQTLSEFFTTVTRKLVPPLTVAEAGAQLQGFVSQWPVLPVTEKVVLEAVRGVRLYQLHFWDAQIWAVARLHRLPTILSEDFNAGARIEDVRFINPFAMDFGPAAWKNALG